MYRRSVRCGHCYVEGHNRLSCPERKKYAEQHPDSYQARVMAKERSDRLETIASRACTYCREQGHNRRGCKTLKEDKRRVISHMADYRARFLKSLESSGLNVGALLLLPCDRNKEYNVMHMITRIAWDKVSHRYEAVDGSDYGNRLGPEEIRFLEARIVGSTYPADYESKSYWDNPPAFNDMVHIDVRHLTASLGDVVHNSALQQFAQAVVTPATSSASPPASFLEATGLPESIRDWYNFNPPQGASDYTSQRCSLDNSCWKSLESILCE